jgi:isopentenyl phosphate kinase
VKVLVTGSRAFDDHGVVERALEELWRKAPGRFVLIHGDGSGVDAIAHAWAFGKAAFGYPIVIRRLRADYRERGQMAVQLRNTAIVRDLKPDLCVAFRSDRHSADMVRRCQAAGIPVREVR